ncbi:hypothetical protein [Pseudoxanthomonas dokdonensis]|uniref:Uncharacterized protein n=1 Tax=Pseudoxanthomonas dokdonensis TaxID=344882 RepID=A0A0R0CUW6_9GAMM|nr:hypothetical protein [Pseudoxanthomonas dokdonensis]KRG70138.1 hypothetical protein ABB29_07935 [Pseudoxanthomonas dokdonensis]
MNDKDASLHWQLRGLRRDASPGHDLWPAIAGRIASLPQQQAEPGFHPVSRWWPMALAASLLLAVGMVWQAGLLPSATAPGVQREAASLTRDYQSAMTQLDQRPPPTELADSLKALDDSASQIRAALRRDPHSRLLLEQLRRTYTQRINLTQRAIMS